MTTVPLRAPSAFAVIAVTVRALLAALGGRLRRTRPAAGPALDVLGLAAVAVGAFLLATWLGWVVVGVSLLIVRHVLIPAGTDG